ncbi:amino acid aminotransferase [Sphingobacterium alkalisoli]|uniref:branched-chain-amino-acid transaminase n=1 Tax=Sphingobacterium alkalisoli TaxID=1874115 RepID=A0A4U0GRY1_9SPHI|nr:aminotransferase class IV [Sphingobacterium alkalisoli]TJY61516.1 amino acid aminotransferase [Sphingobacterium alkalisoli]GGH29901.1 4-amino-4-deoxychorismate lyase [Sphingobacterium alkalisoli]
MIQSLHVIINGQLIPEKEASLGIDDLSIVRGYGIFDYFKTVANRPVFLEDNLDRFFHSAKLMDLPVHYTRDELRIQIRTLMEANKIPESGIKLLLTGGYSKDGYSIATPNLIITQQPLQRNIRQEQQGIKLITYNYHRPFGTVKSIDYAVGILGLKKAKAAGADEVLYAQNGLLSECPRANIFLITKTGKLLTPGKDVLAGITRKYIIEIAKEHLDVEIRDVTLEDMKNAAEAFISSTTKNITPILSIDDTVYGSNPGPLTIQLQHMLEPIVFGSKEKLITEI